MTNLNASEIERQMALLKDWKLEGNRIERKFEFSDFRAAMAFVNQVAELAEKADHHPDILIQYNSVLLTLSTHSAGGLTEKDFALAHQINRLLER